jgi:hypothetical protein
MSGHKKRRKYLVDWQVQGAVLRQSLAQWFVFAVFGAVIFAIFQFLLGGAPQEPWSHRLQTIWPMAASLFVSLLMLLPKFVNDSLKLSNRFAGPILRLRNTLRQVGEGKPYEKMSFRNSDLWQEIAEELDRALTATYQLALNEAQAKKTSEDPPVSSPVEGPDVHEPIACP